MDRKINTFVFVGEIDRNKNFFTEKFLNAECKAWSLGNALEEKECLEDFIRELSSGGILNPQKEAQELMDKMGWG